MKKIFFFIASLFFIINTLFAQDKASKKETFDNNTFNWEEVAEKKKSATIQDGYLVLNVKKKDDPVVITTRFPLDVEHNFKITTHIVIPKLTKDISIGFVFNWVDENNKSCLMLSENHYALSKSDNIIDSQGKIKLKTGKDVSLVISMESKGEKQIFTLNNVTICETKQKIKSPYFGFTLKTADNSSTIKVDDVVIDQVIDDNN